MDKFVFIPFLKDQKENVNCIVLHCCDSDKVIHFYLLCCHPKLLGHRCCSVIEVMCIEIPPY